MSNFALIGAGGYIAPRHLKAIRETENRLIAALDRHDSVGILDSYFMDVSFFTEFERFDRHASKLGRQGGERIDFVSICSPNYLHDAHIRFALRIGADAICEKPLVINPWNLDHLAELETETGQRVYTVLQLRKHQAISRLRDRIAEEEKAEKHEVDLTYITSRGKWYFVSWKGDEEKSGGVATNIGIHFFDMLLWIFGRARGLEVHRAGPDRMAGFLELERARVRWFLSVSADDLPEAVRGEGQRTYRSIRVDGQEVEFSRGFADLHTEVYRDVLAGKGDGIEEARPAIELAYQIRTASVVAPGAHAHPLLKT